MPGAVAELVKSFVLQVNPESLDDFCDGRDANQIRRSLSKKPAHLACETHLSRRSPVTPEPRASVAGLPGLISLLGFPNYQFRPIGLMIWGAGFDI